MREDRLIENIKDKIALIGMGCTKFGERWEYGLDDLDIEIAYEAYKDARTAPNELDYP